MPVVYSELTERRCPECGAFLVFEEWLECDDSISEWMICDNCGYANLIKEASEDG